MRRRGLDHATAEAALTVIQNCELPRGHGALRLLETHVDRAAGAYRGATRLVGLAVAHLDLRGEFEARGLHQPVARTGGQCTTYEQRVIVALHGHQPVVRQVLGGNVPGVLAAAGTSADLQATALSERVEREPAVTADDVAILGDDLA